MLFLFLDHLVVNVLDELTPANFLSVQSRIAVAASVQFVVVARRDFLLGLVCLFR